MMVSLSEIQTAYYMVAATGVLVAAIYYVMSLHNQNQTRQAQLFMQLYSQVSTNQEFFKQIMQHMNVWEYKDVDDFDAKWGIKTNPDENTWWHLDTNFLESVGVLVSRGLVSVDLVESWIGFWVIRHWEKFGPIIKEFRVRDNDPRLFIENERLYTKVKEYRLKHFK